MTMLQSLVRSGLVTCLIATVGTVSYAATIASWEFDGELGLLAPAAADAFDAGLLAASPEVSVGPDLQQLNLAAVPNLLAARRVTVGTGFVADTYATAQDAFAAGEYFATTLTPAAPLDLDSLTFNFSFEDEFAEAYVDVFSSETGATSLGTLSFVGAGGGNNVYQKGQLTVLLDQADFGSVSSPVTFYLVPRAINPSDGTTPWNAADLAGIGEGMGLGNDLGADLVIEGQLAIPEPTTAILLLTGLLAGAGRRG